MSMMSKMAREALMLAAAGTAGYCAYKWMSPSDKQKITRDARRTMEDMNDVRNDMGRMANTIRDTF